jgi:hypothetical protein
MNPIDLKSQIDTLAWGPRGTAGLQAATAQASPAMTIKLAFDDMRAREDLNNSETEILRGCCQLIRTHQWFGLVDDAVTVEASLPPAPSPEGIG